MLTILRAIKQTLPMAERLTIFVVSQHLQRCIFGADPPTRDNHFMQINLSKFSNLFAVYWSDKEQCNPFFSSVKKARKLFFSPQMMSVPVIDGNELWFTI